MSLSQGQGHGKLFNNQYLGKKKISSGSFGVVYLGQNVRTKEYCAIKVEKSSVDDLLSLEREVQILKQIQGVNQVPKLFWFGQEGSNNVMVIQLLGHDLTHFLKIYKKFSLKCVLNIADQMLTVLEAIHKRSVLHRDIKPENILIGRDSEQQVLYLVDYGISKFYRESKGQHIPFKENKPFIGTTRYAPIAAHNGHELSRKDDLESLGYMLIYLLKGQLPWQSLTTQNEEEKIKQVGQMKMKIDTNELCKDMPVEFVRYMDFVRKLSFKSQPDYKYLQQLFRRLAQNSNFQTQDRKFDWSDTHTTQNKSQESSVKRQNRRASADPSSLLIHQVDSGNLASRINNSGQFNSKKQDNEVASNHTSGVGPSSYLRLPDQRYSQLGSSIISLDRQPGERNRSFQSFNSIGSSLGPEGSVMVGFQPSMMNSIVQQASYTSQKSGDGNFSKGFSNVECSPEQQFLVQLQPLSKKSNRSFKDVVNADGLFQDLDMKQSTQMSVRAQMDLNSEEESDLSGKMERLGDQSVLSHFKNPIFHAKMSKLNSQHK